jgi:hypothetical protein
LGKSRQLTSAALALSAISLATMGWVANLGGQIHHAELRSETASEGDDAQPSPSEARP